MNMESGMGGGMPPTEEEKIKRAKEKARLVQGRLDVERKIKEKEDVQESLDRYTSRAEKGQVNPQKDMLDAINEYTAEDSRQAA